MSKPWIKDWILSKQAKNLGVVYNKPTEQSKKTAGPVSNEALNFNLKKRSCNVCRNETKHDCCC